MKELWNNTCVLISQNGDVITSNWKVTRHNEAIRVCGEEVGLEINEMQSMVTMLEELTAHNHIVLLNTGKEEDELHQLKRTGFLALPQSFTESQQEKVEILKMLLEEEYQAITCYRFENKQLRRKSMGNKTNAINVIEEMIPELHSKYPRK